VFYFRISAKTEPDVETDFYPRRLMQDSLADDWRRVEYSMQKAAEVGQLNMQIKTQ
jgi:hypothetical protein